MTCTLTLTAKADDGGRAEQTYAARVKLRPPLLPNETEANLLAFINQASDALSQDVPQLAQQIEMKEKSHGT